MPQWPQYIQCRFVCNGGDGSLDRGNGSLDRGNSSLDRAQLELVVVGFKSRKGFWSNRTREGKQSIGIGSNLCLGAFGVNA